MWYFYIVMLSVIMLNVVMLNVVVPAKYCFMFYIIIASYFLSIKNTL